MDEEVNLGLIKYVYWTISLITGLLLWFLLLVYVDDTDMWFFQFEGLIGDILRLGIIVIMGVISMVAAFVTNNLLTKVFKK